MRTSPAISELVGDAERQDRELVDGPHRLVGDRRLGRARGVGLALVVEERPLAGKTRRLHQRAVDALVAQGAHPHAVRRRVAKRDGERRLLGIRPVSSAMRRRMRSRSCGVGKFGLPMTAFPAPRKAPGGTKPPRGASQVTMSASSVAPARRFLATASLAATAARLATLVSWDRGILAYAVVVGAAAVGLSRRSVLAQVFARGIGWGVLIPMVLATAESLWSRHLPDARSAFFLTTSAAALLLARPALHTAEARAEFSPVGYRRVFLAGSVAAVTVGSTVGLFAAEALRWGETRIAFALSALAASLLASAAGVVRMRAWGVLLAMVTSAAALAVGLLSGSEVVAFGLALGALPGVLLASPLVGARLRHALRPGAVCNAPLPAEVRIGGSDDVLPPVLARARVAGEAEEQELVDQGRLALGEKGTTAA